eukprot:TRINITY_DN5140_c1_g1_i1.p1 TRINITY_DN5140_c1_g1~~TRINITY_DN5140_c1_g1_i1.p1  ORF type:complete len:1381 (+),score=331.86 TRINITY_DN5140_c1_g1_i1:61-4203(+)
MHNASLLSSLGDGSETMQELKRCTREGDVDQVKAMLRGNRSMLSREIEGGGTLLHYAVAEEQEKVCLALLRRHSVVDAVDANGDTPLHIACRIGSQAIVKLLVHYNADVTCRNLQKMSAADVARQSGHRLLASSIEKFLNGQRRQQPSANTSEVSSIPSQSPSFRPNSYAETEPLTSERLHPTHSNHPTQFVTSARTDIIDSPVTNITTNPSTITDSEPKLHADLSGRLQIANVRLSQQNKQINQLQSKLTTLSSQLATANQENESQRSRYEAELAKAEKQAAAQKEEALQKETVILQQMCDIKGDLLTKETKAEENRAQEVDTLKNELSSIRDTLASEHQKELRTLTQKLENQQKDINNKERQLKDHTSEKQKLQDEVSSKVAEVEDLKKELEKQQNSNESKIDDLKKKLEESGEEKAETDEKLASDVAQIAQLSEMLDRKGTEIETLKGELRTVKRADEGKTAELKRLQEELKESERKINDTLKESNSDLNDTITQLQSAHAATIATLENELSAHRTSDNTKTDEIKRLQSELEKERPSDSDERMNQLKAEHASAIQILEGELTAYKTTIQRLQNGIARSDNSSTALEAELTELQNRHDTVLSENESLKSATLDAADPSKDKVIKELKTVLAAAETLSQETQEKLAEALKKQSEMEDELLARRTNDQVTMDMAKTIKRVESDLREAKNKCRALEEQNQQLTQKEGKGDELSKQIESMENQLHLSNAKLQELENTNEFLKGNETGSTSADSNLLQSQLDYFRQENQQLLVKHAAAEEENRILRENESTIASLSETVQRLEADLATTTQDKEAAIASLKDIQKEGATNKDLIEDNKKLQAQERRARESENHLRTNLDHKLAEVTSKHLKEIDLLQQELKREKERRTEAEEELQATKELKASEQKLRSENSELKCKVERITTQGNCVSEEREALLRDAESLQQEIRGQEAIRNEMQSDIDRQKAVNEAHQETIRDLEKRVTQNSLAFRVEIEQTALERKMKNDLRQQVKELQEKLDAQAAQQGSPTKSDLLVKNMKVAEARCQKLQRECLLLSQSLSLEQREKDILEDKVRNLEAEIEKSNIARTDSSNLLRRTSSTPRITPSFPLQYTEQVLTPKSSLIMQEEKQRNRLQSEQLGDLNLIRSSFSDATQAISNEIEQRYQQLDRMKTVQKSKKALTASIDPQEDAIRKLISSSEESDRADIFIEYKINLNSKLGITESDDVLISQQAQRALSKLHRLQSSPSGPELSRGSERSTPDPNTIATRLIDDIDETGKVIGQRPVSIQKDPRLFYQEQCTLTGVRVNTSFLESLPANSSELLSVDLAHNYIGKRGIRTVLDVVSLCKNVRYLDLTDNKLDDGAVSWVADVARKHPSLVRIDLTVI